MKFNTFELFYSILNEFKYFWSFRYNYRYYFVFKINFKAISVTQDQNKHLCLNKKSQKCKLLIYFLTCQRNIARHECTRDFFVSSFQHTQTPHAHKIFKTSRKQDICYIIFKWAAQSHTLLIFHHYIASTGNRVGNTFVHTKSVLLLLLLNITCWISIIIIMFIVVCMSYTLHIYFIIA